jgi:hypothetical protein
MRSTPIAVSIAVLGAPALPLASAPTASAAPSQAPALARATWPCDRHGPGMAAGAQAVAICSQAAIAKGNWHTTTEETTGVSGRVSGASLHR